MSASATPYTDVDVTDADVRCTISHLFFSMCRNEVTV